MDMELLKVPNDFEAILFIPNEQDAQRVEEVLKEQRGQAVDDPMSDSLWSELLAQLRKQQE